MVCFTDGKTEYFIEVKMGCGLKILGKSYDKFVKSKSQNSSLCVYP